MNNEIKVALNFSSSVNGTTPHSGYQYSESRALRVRGMFSKCILFGICRPTSLSGGLGSSSALGSRLRA